MSSKIVAILSITLCYTSESVTVMSNATNGTIVNGDSDKIHQQAESVSLRDDDRIKVVCSNLTRLGDNGHDEYIIAKFLAGNDTPTICTDADESNYGTSGDNKLTREVRKSDVIYRLNRGLSDNELATYQKETLLKKDIGRKFLSGRVNIADMSSPPELDEKPAKDGEVKQEVNKSNEEEAKQATPTNEETVAEPEVNEEEVVEAVKEAVAEEEEEEEGEEGNGRKEGENEEAVEKEKKGEEGEEEEEEEGGGGEGEEEEGEDGEEEGGDEGGKDDDENEKEERIKEGDTKEISDPDDEEVSPEVTKTVDSEKPKDSDNTTTKSASDNEEKSPPSTELSHTESQGNSNEEASTSVNKTPPSSAPAESNDAKEVDYEPKNEDPNDAPTLSSVDQGEVDVFMNRLDNILASSGDYIIAVMLNNYKRRMRANRLNQKFWQRVREESFKTGRNITAVKNKLQRKISAKLGAPFIREVANSLKEFVKDVRLPNRKNRIN